MFSSKVLFKEKLNSLFSEKDKTDSVLIEKVFIFSFLLLKEKENSISLDNWKNTFFLFEQLGVEKFIDLITKTSSKVIYLPDEQDLKESLLLASTYYYRNIMGYDWKQIKDILNLPTLNSIKYSSKIQQLEDYLNKKFNEVCEQCKKN